MKRLTPILLTAVLCASCGDGEVVEADGRVQSVDIFTGTVALGTIDSWLDYWRAWYAVSAGLRLKKVKKELALVTSISIIPCGDDVPGVGWYVTGYAQVYVCTQEDPGLMRYALYHELLHHHWYVRHGHPDADHQSDLWLTLWDDWLTRDHSEYKTY